jgi:hypothetical protein
MVVVAESLALAETFMVYVLLGGEQLRRCRDDPEKLTTGEHRRSAP